MPFLFSVFPDAFLFDFTLSITNISPQSLFDGVGLRLQKIPANSMGYFCCEPFGGSEPCVSLVGGMTQLTAALMRCDKLSKLWESKTRDLFLRGFPFLKRINRVFRFDDSCEIWPKCFLAINA